MPQKLRQKDEEEKGETGQKMEWDKKSNITNGKSKWDKRSMAKQQKRQNVE